jgi:hypothetical protein
VSQALARIDGTIAHSCAMKKAGTTNHRLFGTLVLERLTGTPVPGPLKAPLAAFKAAHATFETATRDAENARTARDEALAAIGEADRILDTTLAELANALVGAGFGARSNPFATFSPHAPAALASLPYAKEVAATRALLSKVTKKKPEKRISKEGACETRRAFGRVDQGPWNIEKTRSRGLGWRRRDVQGNVCKRRECAGTWGACEEEKEEERSGRTDSDAGELSPALPTILRREEFGLGRGEPCCVPQAPRRIGLIRP